MATAGDILNLALKDCGAFGIGQTPLAVDITDGLRRLNMMISQWNKRRWLVYHLLETSVATDGGESYTVGPAQELNIGVRTDRIDAAFVRTAGADVSLKQLRSREEYDRVRLKSDAGAPEYFFFDSGYPTGVVYVWPVAPAGSTLRINTKAVLDQFASTSETVDLPAEYEEAIYFNLITRLRAAYRLAPDPFFDSMAEETLAVIQQANLQPAAMRTPKGMGATVADIVNLALEDSGAFGADNPPTFQDTMDALWRLNMMVGQWNRRRWVIYHLVDTACVCTGALSYAVGPGEDFDIARPDSIEAAYIRQIVPTNSTPVDWPLKIINSREDYSSIAIKRLAAAPSEYIFYDSGFPDGALYPWPLPNSNYEIHILTKAVISTFAALDDAINLPPEYFQALYLNLAVNLRMAYDSPERPLPQKRDLVGLAKASLATIRRSNFQISNLRMPRGISRGPAYNIYSDRGN